LQRRWLFSVFVSVIGQKQKKLETDLGTKPNCLPMQNGLKKRPENLTRDLDHNICEMKNANKAHKKVT